MSTWRRATEPAGGEDSAGALSVSQLNRLAKGLLEEGIGEILLSGEITGFKSYPSGHWYFSLKDEDACVGAVMFAGRNRACRVRPTDGMQVLVRGRVSLYEKSGKFQVIADEMQPSGEGALFVALEKLKAKLHAEGLFDSARKRALPLLPRRIGIATSAAGAALRDVIKVLETRGARVDVVVAHCRVQGDGSAEEIACALRLLERLGGLDAIIVGRGGGSLEDLWAFNEEAVVRAIAASTVPVISAVGHEVDVTLADLVADVRAATPSQAAEIVCASAEVIVGRVETARRRLAQSARAACREVRVRLAAADSIQLNRLLRGAVESRLQRTDELRSRLERSLRQGLRSRALVLGGLTRRLAPGSLRQVVRRRRQIAEERGRVLASATRRLVEKRRERMLRAQRALHALSPLSVLDRGYAVLLTDAGRAVRAASDVGTNEELTARLAKGRLRVKVTRQD
jgi:exodeoxyribonuclease VII large subunit